MSINTHGLTDPNQLVNPIEDNPPIDQWTDSNFAAPVLNAPDLAMDLPGDSVSAVASSIEDIPTVMDPSLLEVTDNRPNIAVPVEISPSTDFIANATEQLLDDDLPTVDLTAEAVITNEKPTGVPGPALVANSQVTIDVAPYGSEYDENSDKVPFFATNATESEISAFLEKNPHLIDRKGNINPRNDYEFASMSGVSSLIDGDVLQKALYRPGSEWGQNIKHNGVELGIWKPTIGEPKDGQQLKDGEALTILRSRLGIGGTYVIPLWHSGIWATISSPTKNELLDLDHDISSELIEAGRNTRGLIFSNTSVLINSHLMDFFLNKIIKTNVKNWTIETIRDLIDQRDLQLIGWGIACSKWPGSYPYIEACINASSTPACNHITKGNIRLPKTLIVDRSALTEKQKALMANRTGSYTVEEIREYQQDGFLGRNHSYELKNGTSVTFEVPSARDHIRNGLEWLEGLRDAAYALLGSDANPASMNRQINRKVVLTALREYGHWVKSFIIDNGEPITSRTVINDTLDSFDADDELAEKFFTSVRDFIENNVIAFMALPRYECPNPNCRHPSGPEYAKHPLLIPQDAISRFFTLVDHDLSLAKSI